MPGGDAEQGSECGVPGAPAVEAEDEFIEVGLEVFAAQPVIDAQEAQTLRLEKIRWTQGSTM